VVSINPAGRRGPFRSMTRVAEPASDITSLPDRHERTCRLESAGRCRGRIRAVERRILPLYRIRAAARARAVHDRTPDRRRWSPKRAVSAWRPGIAPRHADHSATAATRGSDRRSGDHLAPTGMICSPAGFAEQADQCDTGGAGRPDVEQAVDDADQETCAE